LFLKNYVELYVFLTFGKVQPSVSYEDVSYKKSVYRHSLDPYGSVRQVLA